MSKPLEFLIEDRSFVEKKWGAEEILINNDKYCSKLLHIKPGFQSSLHFHNIKDETFIAVAGGTWVKYIHDGFPRQVLLIGWRRDVLHLPPGTPHRFWSAFAGGSVLLEVSTPHDDADVVRLEPSGEIT